MKLYAATQAVLMQSPNSVVTENEDIPTKLFGSLTSTDILPKASIPGLFDLAPHIVIQAGLTWDEQLYQDIHFGQDFSIPIQFDIRMKKEHLPRVSAGLEDKLPQFRPSFNLRPLVTAETKVSSFTAEIAPEIKLTAKVPFLGWEETLVAQDANGFTVSFSESEPSQADKECPDGKRKVSFGFSKVANVFSQRRQSPFLASKIMNHRVEPVRVEWPSFGDQQGCMRQ